MLLITAAPPGQLFWAQGGLVCRSGTIISQVFLQEKQTKKKKINPPRWMVIPSSEKKVGQTTTTRLGSPVLKANNCSGPFDSIRTVVRPSYLHSLRLSTPLPKLHGPTYWSCGLTSSQTRWSRGREKQKKRILQKVLCHHGPTEHVNAEEEAVISREFKVLFRLPASILWGSKEGVVGRSWTVAGLGRKKLWQRSRPRCSELTFHRVRKLFVASH